MSVGGLRPAVIAAKTRLIEGRAKLKERHGRTALGVQVCHTWADVLDATVVELYEAALTDLGDDGIFLREHVALAPHGGYGRRDVAPYSDVDLMILHDSAAASRVAPLASRLMRDVFDVGLMLGQSVRTPRQACLMAAKDATVLTSLAEARLLIGDADLYEKFTSRFHKLLKRKTRSAIAAIVSARDEERTQYGETVYLLEPNVKRSRGGLRDLQLLRWIGAARYGTTDLDGLRLQGALSRSEHATLSRAHEFLLRLRNEMHFHAGKARDVLDRAEQMRLAELYGYRGAEGPLPVEEFMREYFRMTDSVSNLVTRFISRATRPGPWVQWLSPLFSHQFEGDFRVGPSAIAANERGLRKLQQDLSQILRLASLANLYNKPIAYSTSEAICDVAPRLPDTINQEAADRFLALMSHTARLGPLLRDLHKMGVLEKVIPAFGHARSLLQFNDYHKYTVDEHSFRAVERATEFGDADTPLGWVYRRIKRKWLLHLALLIHDLGKGFTEDHSEVGRRIADDVANRLYLSESDADVLKFLVHKHLTMSHLAFRRDTSDEALVTRFAVDVGSPETLQMLFVLTGADMAAVGPDVLNAWKVDVLSDLYERTMQRLAGDAPALSRRKWFDACKRDVFLALNLEPGDEVGRRWYVRQLELLPTSYMRASPPEAIASDLAELNSLDAGEFRASARFQQATQTTEYRVVGSERTTPGIFHKLTGALSSQGLQILSAEINTLADGLVFDRFTVTDPDYADEPPESRHVAVCDALRKAASGESKPPVFRRIWRASEQRSSLDLAPQPTQVRVDNNSSERYTILDVFAADRTGLLFTIARKLFELGLSVAVAKIGTYLDQVVDVFYVTDDAGKKIESPTRLREIREELLTAIKTFETKATAKSRA